MVSPNNRIVQRKESEVKAEKTSEAERALDRPLGTLKDETLLQSERHSKGLERGSEVARAKHQVDLRYRLDRKLNDQIWNPGLKAEPQADLRMQKQAQSAARTEQTRLQQQSDQQNLLQQTQSLSKRQAKGYIQAISANVSALIDSVLVGQLQNELESRVTQSPSAQVSPEELLSWTKEFLAKRLGDDLPLELTVTSITPEDCEDPESGS
ncbi:MAG: hypothetical protein DCC75_11900 [Proteobacteria bacterium]|nr:MAG: hypothetical protein DCC75_11900 [Pseudomonadota bacterium]